MADEKSAELGVVIEKASGRGEPGEEPPIPRGMPREEINTVSSESSS